MNIPATSASVKVTSLAVTTAFLTLVALVVVLSPGVGAASRNEVLINVLYDGVGPFDATEPTAPAGAAPETHTPGLDGGPQNLVVRTNDTYAVRVDWNINEDHATDVALTVVLPAHSQWQPDATGMFAGCDPATSSFPNPQTLICGLLDQQEGSNGVIRPVALLNDSLDNTTFDVRATLTTGEDTTGVVDGLDQELTVSEAPFVDYIKAEPTVSALVNNGTENGYVVLFPLTFVDYSQVDPPEVGVGPINDSVPVQLHDHMWSLTPSARVATATEMTAAGFAGDPCGDYAQAGSYVSGNGTWACGTGTTGAGGYPVVPIAVSGFTSRPFPPTLADTTANDPRAPQVSSGQIAVWLTEAEVNAAIADPDIGSGATDARLENSILAEDGATVIADASDVIEAPGQGTSGPAIEGPIENNTAFALFGAAPPPPPSPGFLTGHDIRFLPGPLQLVDLDFGSGHSQVNHDGGGPADGGLGQIPGTNSGRHGTNAGADDIGQVSRGQVLTISARTHAGATDPGSVAAFNSCVAFDTAHYELTDLPSTVIVREAFAPTNGGSISTTGYGSTSPNSGLAHVVSGDTVSRYQYRAWVDGFGGDKAFPAVVEVTNAPLPTHGASGQTGIDDDALTCDLADAGSLGWVDATGDLSAFDPNNDGDYELITLARIRALEAVDLFPSAEAQAADGRWDTTGMTTYFNIRVKDDLAVNSDDQELFAFTSHSFTADPWDGTAAPVLTDGGGNPDTTCRPYSGSSWSADDQAGDGSNTASGWCNNRFHDDGTDSFDDGDLIDWPQHTGGTSQFSQWFHGSGAVVNIVGAKLAVDKINVDGPGDIADNGQTVQFTITPRVTGGATEALSDVRITDILDSRYQFVQFIDLPDVPHDCTQSGQTVTCQYSDPAGATGGPLPAGLPGGWPGTADPSFTIEVVVTGAVADPDDPVILTNRARAQSSGLGAWDPIAGEFPFGTSPDGQDVSAYASSFLPLPADEGAIIKTVDTLEGPCELHPAEDPPPAGWGDRCSLIDFEGNMSFTLNLTNEGNTEFTNIRLVDVFPHSDDGPEENGVNISSTDTVGGSPQTDGDGRDPASDFAGTLGYVSLTGADQVLVSGDDPLTISRDPDRAVAETVWCTYPAGVVVHAGDAVGAAPCPVAPEDVTATFSVTNGPLAPGATLTHTLTLDAEDHGCDDIWTNTFGAQTDQILLPIRSNDVSIMVDCEFDLALEKTIDPTFTPGSDWITPGATTIDFLMEVTNQGDPIEDFELTDYVDTSVFTFAATNTTGITGGSATLPYSWDATDAAAPVVTVDGPLADGETVTVPVTLVIDDPTGPLTNWAEISSFDSDGDPTNGDSDPTNPDNPSTGALVDEDSIPDGTQANDPQPTGPGAPGDGVIAGDGSGSDPVAGDEDDHDVAGIPVYDLEFIKTPAATTFDLTVTPPTVTFDLTVTNQGTADAYLIDVIDYGAPGLTYDPALTAAAWAAASLTGVTDNAPTFAIAGPLNPTSSVTIPVVYRMDVTRAPFTNAAEISAFDSDADPGNPPDPFAVDADSTPDATDDDEVIDHDVQNNDPDGDGNLNESTPGDEDDHDIETIELPWDLALVKTFVSMTTPLLPDGTATMLITVTNQGPAVETVDVTDHLDPALWSAFEPALNPDGPVDASSTAVSGFGFTWDGADPTAPVATITPDVAGDKLGFGETVAVPITVRIAPGFDTSQSLVNVAEISNFDSDQDPTNGDAASGALVDIDSTPDGTNESTGGETIGADLVDDAIDGNGEPGNDEDDHDPVIIPIMDLALRKIVDPTTTFPVAHGSQVSFLIEVINQGNVHASNPALVDYADPTMWDPFDPALNPAGTTTGVALAYAWATSANGQDGDVALTGVLAPGETAIVPITLVVASGADLTALQNTAEISGATASDATGTEITNPDGSPVVDVDSVPDGDNSDPVTDDVTDGSSGDEDDHDVAFVTAPTYSLGNQVWFDEDNSGTLDPGETPFEGVVVELFSDADGDGRPDDLNGDGVIDSDDAIATSTTGPDGDYLFTDLAPGDHIVGIGPSNFEPGGPLFGTLPSDPVSADPNDDIDNDNNGAAGPHGYVWSGPVTIGDGEPIGETGLNNDPNHPDSLSNLTVDFGFHRPTFDLALEKTLAAGQPEVVAVGDSVTFTIEIINQGNVTAIDIEVVDYLPAAMTLDDPDWTAGPDGSATTVVPGPLADGGSTTVDITVVLNSVGDLENVAEIASAIPVDAVGAVLSMPNGAPLPDFDSVFDALNDDPVVDGVTDENGLAGGDEDDHDVARIRVAETPVLAFTGAWSLRMAILALLLIVGGGALTLSNRRRVGALDSP